ncbi:MAG TPA: hypothetical protein GX498_03500 [Clostridiales bacterium]|nr:hypothetical protein [Clostridiales bacterium]
MKLQFLYEYQQQENYYNKLIQQINEIVNDDMIKRLRDEYTRLKNEYDRLSSKKTEIEKEILRRNSNYKRLQENMTNYEKLMYTPEINNVKKLETLKKQIEDVEKNIMKEKAEIEGLEKNLKVIEEGILEIKKKYAFIKKKYNKTKEDNEYRMNFLLNEKSNTEEFLKELRTKIDDDIFEYYIKMKEKISHPISDVKDRKCGGCGVEVPAMDYEAMKLGDYSKCQNCGRILVYIKKNN